MAGEKLVGANYVPPDHVAKVTGRAKYAEDFRADGMLFAKLLLSPMPHARVRSIDTSAALAMPGVRAILTADDVPDLNGGEKALTNEPFYAGEPILAVAAVDEETAADAIERIVVDLEPLPFVIDPLDSLRPGTPSARLDGNVWSAPRPPTPGAPPGPPAPASAGDREVDRRGLRRRASPASCRWASTLEEWAVRRSRRRLRRRRARARRDLRRAVHRAPPDGNAQRDGLLAERQAVPARLHAERRLHARPASRAGSGIPPSDVVLICEYTGGGFGSKGAGAVSIGDPGAAVEEGQRAGDDAHQPRGGELHRPRAHQHDRPRQGRLRQGRPHHGARSLHRPGLGRLRPDGRLPLGRPTPRR